MTKGRVKEASSPTKTVRFTLTKAQPKVFVMSCEPDNDIAEPHPIQFDGIDGTGVVRRMDSAAGSGWKRLCTSLGVHSADLCDDISCLTRRICTTYMACTAETQHHTVYAALTHGLAAKGNYLSRTVPTTKGHHSSMHPSNSHRPEYIQWLRPGSDRPTWRARYCQSSEASCIYHITSTSIECQHPLSRELPAEAQEEQNKQLAIRLKPMRSTTY